MDVLEVLAQEEVEDDHDDHAHQDERELLDVHRFIMISSASNHNA